MGQVNVLYIVSTFKRCGPNNQLYNLISHLNRKKIKPSLLAISPEPNDSLKQHFEDLGLIVHTLNLSRIGALFLAPQKLGVFLKKHTPDIIQTQGIRADILVSYFFKRHPHVIRAACYVFEDYPIRYGKLLGTLIAYLHVSVLRNATRCVSVSKSMSQKLKNHRVETITIYNSINLAHFYPLSLKEKNRQKEALNLRPNTRIILSVGHLSKIKDPLTVIKGFFLLNVDQPIKLMMLGNGELMNKCLNYSDSNNIIFTGRVKNVVPYLQVADVFVSASRSEGMPNTVLEAAAFGLPLCLSDIPQHQEIISLASQAGMCFRLQHEVSLSEKLSQLLNEPNRDFAARQTAVYNMAKKYFDVAKMSKKYQRLYNTVN